MFFIIISCSWKLCSSIKVNRVTQHFKFYVRVIYFNATGRNQFMKHEHHKKLTDFEKIHVTPFCNIPEVLNDAKFYLLVLSGNFLPNVT